MILTLVFAAARLRFRVSDVFHRGPSAVRDSSLCPAFCLHPCNLCLHPCSLCRDARAVLMTRFRNITVNFGDVCIPSFWLSAFSPACVSEFMELLSFRDHDVLSLKMTTSGHTTQTAGLLPTSSNYVAKFLPQAQGKHQPEIFCAYNHRSGVRCACGVLLPCFRLRLVFTDRVSMYIFTEALLPEPAASVLAAACTFSECVPAVSPSLTD